MNSLRMARRLGQFPEYVHARLAKDVAKVEKASGRKVLNLGIGSPDIPPSKRYIDKLSELIRESMFSVLPDQHSVRPVNVSSAWQSPQTSVLLANIFSA